MKLAVHVAKVPLNGPRAEDQLRADPRIRQTIAGRDYARARDRIGEKGDATTLIG